MATYGVEKPAKNAPTGTTGNTKFPEINISSFLSPTPWVLVPNGSFMGFFDGVPAKLRTGPWSNFAPISILLVLFYLIHSCPDIETYLEDKRSYSTTSSYPSVMSPLWCYNVLACVFMTSLYVYCSFKRTPFIIVTYTVLSWLMNALRHGINATAPFLTDGHPLLVLNELLRLPALLSATTTFVVWWLLLFPFMMLHVMNTTKKRKDFINWNFEPRMVQLHLCNIIYSIMNTLITCRHPAITTTTNIPDILNTTITTTTTFLESSLSSSSTFAYEDVWFVLAYSSLYILFYLFVLDRIGLHLYPIFSPRSRLCGFFCLVAFAMQFSLYHAWNYLIINHSNIFSIRHLVATYVSFTFTSFLIPKWNFWDKTA